MKKKILNYPLATEKAVRLIEAENKITFVVDRRANKAEIKSAIEKEFNAKVVSINTIIKGGKKIAYAKLSKDTPALDIATKLGLM
jgi:large subunit ribosomal protein L23